MASVTMKAALRSIDRLFGGGSVAGLPDGELLGRFAGDRDEAAFAALVARHGPMVLATCRAILRDGHDAEDAFQAAFLALARRAGSIREGESLGGWLHRVARRVATRAGIEADRRRGRERRAGAILALRPPSSPPRDDDGPALHAEIDRLPESLRRPLILCDLEGLTRAQAAHQLGWTEGAVRGRLARARDRLRARLTRRGLAPSVAFAAPGPVPTAWLDAAARASVGVGEIPAAASLLASAAIRSLAAARLRLVSAVALGLVASGGLVAGLARSGPPTPTAPDVPRARPALAAADPVPAADPNGTVAYSGRVLDPEGRPYPGARVYLDYFRVAWTPSITYPPSPRSLATSGPDGRFRFAVAKSAFPPWFEPWRRASVVAVGDGFGPGLSDSDEPDSDGELTVRLAPDDVPLAGRVLDLEGRPIAGLSVRVDLVEAPSGGSLEPWARDGRDNDRETLYELQGKHLKKVIRNDPVAGPIAATTTGPDGRFRVAGVGRERVVHLTIEGPTIRTIQARAMTRGGESVRLPHFFNARSPSVETYHASPADYVASPTRPIEGVVRDKDGGEPVAGASIESYRLADSDTANSRFIRATTDARGRFRLVGMPRGAGNEIYVIPPADRPYFAAKVAIGDAPGLAPLAVEVALKRGIWIEGRLTDEATGRPVAGGVAYHVAAANPRRAEVAGLAEIGLNGDYSFNTRAGPDGRFRVPGLPGRGLVVAESGSADYLAVEAEVVGLEGRDFLPYAWRMGDAFARVDIPDQVDPFPLDLAFQPALRREVTALDPDGKPLAGSRIYGLFPLGGWWDSRNESTVAVHGLRPPRSGGLIGVLAAPSVPAAIGRLKPVRPRVLVLRHDGRKLAGTVDVRGDDPAPLAVKLEPWATAVGRLVDADGRPRPRSALLARTASRSRGGGGEIGHSPARIVTDEDGRFLVDGLVSGLAYRLLAEDADGLVKYDRPIPVPPARPGATVDLGDVR